MQRPLRSEGGLKTYEAKEQKLQRTRRGGVLGCQAVPWGSSKVWGFVQKEREGDEVRASVLVRITLTGWGEGVGGISSRGWETQEDQAPSGSETSLPAPQGLPGPGQRSESWPAHSSAPLTPHPCTSPTLTLPLCCSQDELFFPPEARPFGLPVPPQPLFLCPHSCWPLEAHHSQPWTG